MLPAAMNMVQMLSQLLLLASVQEAQLTTRGQQYLGVVTQKSHTIVGTILRQSSPANPWVSATFANHGPDPVFIGINSHEDMTRLEPGESLTVDFSNAQRRIQSVFFSSIPDGRASVEVVAKF